MQNIKDKLLFIRRGGETQRFHSVLTVQEDTVGSHSFGVAWMLWLLTQGLARPELLMAGLAHDLAEHQVGDIPAPTKRGLGDMRAKVNDLEKELLRSAGLEFTLTTEENRLLKLADALDGMFFCVRERTLGNLEIEMVFEKFSEYANEKLTREFPHIASMQRELDIFSSIQQLWNEVHNHE